MADRQASLPALQSLLTDAEPNNRARALWVMDRLGGEVREAVVAQLHDDSGEFRALAVRILRRHGQQYGDAILKLSADPSPEVRREVLLAIRNLQGPPADEALARLAATYDGSDRYQLEAIHIAAADRKAALLDRLEKNGPLTAAQFGLLQLLSPDRAAASVLARLSDPKLDLTRARLLLDSAVNIPSVDAEWALLKLSTDNASPAALRREAFVRVVANVSQRGPWTAIVNDERFVAALHSLLGDKDLQPAALSAIGKLHITALGADVLALARDESLGARRVSKAFKSCPG